MAEITKSPEGRVIERKIPAAEWDNFYQTLGTIASSAGGSAFTAATIAALSKSSFALTLTPLPLAGIVIGGGLIAGSIYLAYEWMSFTQQRVALEEETKLGVQKLLNCPNGWGYHFERTPDNHYIVGTCIAPPLSVGECNKELMRVCQEANGYIQQRCDKEGIKECFSKYKAPTMKLICGEIDCNDYTIKVDHEWDATLHGQHH